MENSLTKVQLKILKSFQYNQISKVNYSADLISNDTKLSIYLVEEEIQFLIDNKLIDVDPFSKETKYYRLTNKGKILLINEKEAFKEKIMWSIIAPLITAVIGTLITNLLFPN
ncbi:hypothetical protein [Enterococcus gallinarum]|uniref:hypothetical protein n=1 Tax=Enterococcus gallinarum TaxID=1353 RepID=UPI0018A97FA0|nr:hypothetical protein [Enterococcus gallinarum]